jgi:hypothetical protein
MQRLRLSWRWMLTIPSFGETPNLKTGNGLVRVRRIHTCLIMQAATNNVDIYLFIYLFK